MGKSIKLSEKHGLNPSIQVCFYCGKETGEIILFGKLKGDKEAPRQTCNSLKPCKDCLEKYKNDTLIVEYNMEEQNPTGRWIAVDKKYIADEDIKKSPVALATESTFDSILKGDTDKNDI